MAGTEMVGTGMWHPGDTNPVYFAFYFEMNGFSHK
jgi:hypothetical protein